MVCLSRFLCYLYPCCILAVALMFPTSTFASGVIGYGSRAGMEVTVVSMSGLDTTNAVIRTRHTRENAITFCREYVKKVTEGCIREELETRLNDEIMANCDTGLFTDFFGNTYQFKGINPEKDAMTKYVIVELKTGQIADGSSASGYSLNMGLYQALCPRRAPQDYY